MLTSTILSSLVWLAFCLCLLVMFLQLIPWFVDLGRQLIEWWNFQLVSGNGRGAIHAKTSLGTDFLSSGLHRIAYGAATGILTISATFFSKPLGICIGATAIALPLVLKARQRAKMRFSMEQALPDAMTKLAAIISAGQPIHQAMIELPERVDFVLSPCFASLRSDLKLGISLGDALKRLERRLALDEFVAFASCVRVGLSSGGTLGPSIERLAKDMRTRLNLRAKLKVLTVQARGQAWIMAVLPVVTLGAISLVDSEGFMFLTQTIPGRSALLIAIAMNVLGAWWVKRLARSKWF